MEPAGARGAALTGGCRITRSRTRRPEDTPWPEERSPLRKRVLRSLGFRHSPIYDNAVYIMLRTVTYSAFGLGFWIVAAHYYRVTVLGYAAALITLSSFLATLAEFGFGMGVIRFLPETLSDRERTRGMVNTVLTLCMGVSVVLAVLYVIGVRFWTPSMSFVQDDASLVLAFIAMTAFYAAMPLIDNVFLSLLRARYILANSIAFGLRVPLLLIFAVSPALGIYVSYAVGAAIGVAINLYFFLPRLLPHYHFRPSIRIAVVKPLMGFSIGNKLADIIDASLGTLLPFLIISVRSPEENAWFYIVWFVGMGLFVIPKSMALSLFAENSQVHAHRRQNFVSAMRGALVFLTPAALVIWVFGGQILRLFGLSFVAGGLPLLRWLVLASPFVLVTSVYFALVRVQKRVVPIIASNAFVTVFTVATSYQFLPALGIAVIGIAFLAAEVILALVIGISWLLGRTPTIAEPRGALRD